MKRAPLLVAPLALAHPAWAQESPPPPPEVSVNGDAIMTADKRGLDKKGEILVVARRVKGQVQTEQAPILTLDEDDIAAYGVGSIQELVAALVPQTGTGRGRGDGTPVFLLNGMRISNFREMRGIPPEAIRRVEVLPEKVALKYGFRPDSRVVNFILKEQFRSISNEGELTLPARGGFTGVRDEATAVAIDKGARVNVTGTYQRTSAETEAARGIIEATAPEQAAFRTLQPATSSTALNATLARPLGTGAGLTVNALIQRDSSDALNGIKPTDQTQALLSASRTTTASLGLGLNLPLGTWLLAATLDASHVRSDSRIDQVAALEPQSSALTTDSATSLATLSGRAWHGRAGDAALTVKAGFAWSGVAGANSRDNVDTRLRRGDAQAGFSLDVPLTSAKDHVLGAIGDWSVNVNGEAHQLSDFGGLVDWGAGVTWKPGARWTVSANSINSEAAPGLSTLASPDVITPGVSVYDFVRNQTVLAAVTTGGNPALLREKQRDVSVSANWTLPFGGGNDTLVLEYFRNHSDNPATAFPLLTGAVQQAFAGRITRDSTGAIIAIDETPISLAMTRSSRLRAMLNLGGNFGKPDPAMAQRRRGWGGGGGFGGPPRGPGGPPPPGGPGRGGPGGGRGFGGGPGGPPPSDGRGRWNMSLSYSYELTNTAQLAPGGAVFDQLRGDALTGNGVARHTVNLDAGGFYRGFGLRMAGNYASATHVSGSGAPGSLSGNSGPLDFGSLATVNLRLFADLGRMPKLVKKVPMLKGSRLSLAVNNVFDGQQKVTDPTGAVPLRYQAGYLDPVGRVIKLELRKLF